MSSYVFTPDVHSVATARAAFRHLFPAAPPASLLDVGCGNGTWLAAAHEAGVADIVGLDISGATASGGHVGGARVLQRDLSQCFDLGRTFDAVICLEVAEHLEAVSADALVASLCHHADVIYFSAACPGQFGQGHLNCQWPAYWQARFNGRGFLCSDAIRWEMWHDRDVKPWYRQNLFCARRDETHAGAEPRLVAVVHPEMLALMHDAGADLAVDQGHKPLPWYLGLMFQALRLKLARRFGRTAK